MHKQHAHPAPRQIVVLCAHETPRSNSVHRMNQGGATHEILSKSERVVFIGNPFTMTPSSDSICFEIIELAPVVGHANS